ncbi:MAG: class I SAM-dependent methyltransferase [candidate division KSB1 bacterium]|jgi:ubiquinone/menaquinone biosynthesis C-methylase UbiE|nr:class I SAM-dependent methyltransferase [candidate division KSB1 bacterium]
MDAKVTRDYFNELASGWDENIDSESLHIRRILSMMTLDRADTILDLGCGTGILFPVLESLVSKSASIYAMDYAKCMVDLASRNRANNFRFVCGDAQDLPFCDNTFCRIIAFQVFPHITDQKHALNECRRVLKQGGEMCIFHVHSSHEINAFHASLSGPVRHHTLPEGHTMKGWMEETGLTVMSAIDHPGEYLMHAIKK